MSSGEQLSIEALLLNTKPRIRKSQGIFFCRSDVDLPDGGRAWRIGKGVTPYIAYMDWRKDE